MVISNFIVGILRVLRYLSLCVFQVAATVQPRQSHQLHFKWRKSPRKYSNKKIKSTEDCIMNLLFFAPVTGLLLDDILGN